MRININNPRAKDLATLEISDVINVHWDDINQNMFVEDITHHILRGKHHDMTLLLVNTENYGSSLVFDDSDHGIVGTNTFGR